MKAKISSILENNNIKIINNKIQNDFDSLQILDLIADLEKSFKIQISLDDIQFSNLSDLDKIENLVKKYL